MNIELTHDQAVSLLSLLQSELRQVSRQIAAADDARHRAALGARRQLLDEVAEALGAAIGLHALDRPDVEKEMAHPGD